MWISRTNIIYEGGDFLNTTRGLKLNIQCQFYEPNQHRSFPAAQCWSILRTIILLYQFTTLISLWPYFRPNFQQALSQATLNHNHFDKYSSAAEHVIIASPKLFTCKLYSFNAASRCLKKHNVSRANHSCKKGVSASSALLQRHKVYRIWGFESKPLCTASLHSFSMLDDTTLKLCVPGSVPFDAKPNTILSSFLFLLFFHFQFWSMAAVKKSTNSYPFQIYCLFAISAI